MRHAVNIKCTPDFKDNTKENVKYLTNIFMLITCRNDILDIMSPIKYIVKINFTYFFLLFYFLDFIYFYQEGNGERKRRRETSMCGCL